MSQSITNEVTHLLADWSAGNKQALDKLIPLVHDELRKLARSYMRRERADHTLQPTALVNEAYMKLVDQRHVHWQNRAHFFGIAAQLMRRILVDHARGNAAIKRGGSEPDVPLEGLEIAGNEFGERDIQLLSLDTALEELSKFDPKQSQIVELRYFGGLTIEETAEVMGLSPATIKREWSMAKAWLHREIKNQSAESKPAHDP